MSDEEVMRRSEAVLHTYLRSVGILLFLTALFTITEHHIMAILTGILAVAEILGAVDYAGKHRHLKALIQEKSATNKHKRGGKR